MNTYHALLLAAGLLAGTTASADTLARYTTTNTIVGTTSLSDSINFADITAGDVTMTYTENNKVAGRFVAWDWTEATTAAALANDQYIGFTVSVDFGKQLDLEALNLVLNDQNQEGDWAVYSSLDDFATALGSGTVSTNFDQVSIDLSSAAFDAVQGDLEFRIVFAALANQWTFAGLADDTSGLEGTRAIELTGIVEDGVAPPAPVVTIVDSSVQSIQIYELTITPEEAPGAPENLYPIRTQNAVSGPWADAAHSDNPYGPFVVTNLTYSDQTSGDYVIYIQGAGASETFGLDLR